MPAFLVTGEEAEGGRVTRIVLKPPPEERVAAVTWEDSVFKEVSFGLLGCKVVRARG